MGDGTFCAARLSFEGAELVGTGRFELPTPRTPSECSTRLSHVPTVESRCRCESKTSGGVDQRILHQPNDFRPRRRTIVAILQRGRRLLKFWRFFKPLSGCLSR